MTNIVKDEVTPKFTVTEFTGMSISQLSSPGIQFGHEDEGYFYNYYLQVPTYIRTRRTSCQQEIA